MSGDDSGFLLVLGGVAGEFQNFGGQILKNGGQVDGGSSSDSFAVSALLQESGDSSHWELETSLGGS